MTETRAPHPSFPVSVIIPTYNRAHVVGAAIDSVLAQSSPADQILVVDDGSTDDTRALLEGYGDRIEPVFKANGGAAGARNAGLARARHPWAAFLDSDDLWPTDRLAILRRDLRSDAEARAGTDAPPPVAHMGEARMTGDGYDAKLSDIRGFPGPTGRAERDEDPLRRVIAGVFSQATAVRLDLAVELGGFSEDMEVHEDTAMFSALATRGPWLFTGDETAVIRRLPGDDMALSNLESTKRLRYRALHLLFLERLAARPWLTAAQRAVVDRTMSGVLLTLADAQAEAGETRAARRSLLRSARLHPSPLKGWIKAMPALLLGRGGSRLALRLLQGRVFNRA